MLRFSGSGQNPGSSVLDELQLSNGLLWKAGEETITIIHPAGDKGIVVNSVLLKCRKLRREDQETSDWIVSRISLF